MPGKLSPEELAGLAYYELLMAEGVPALPGGQEPLPMPPLPLTGVFADLPDPRRDTRNTSHRLTDLLAIATCAVLGGA